MKLDILVFASHPDDAELAIGGTIAALSDQGKKVGIADLTMGEMGTRGSKELRMKEARRASEILGVVYRKNLEIPDTRIDNSRENQLKVIEVVRATRPDICIIGAPHDRHPDHGRGTALVSDALFYCGLRKIETRHEGKAQEPWRPAHIMNYMQDQPVSYDFVFDITGYMDKKNESMLAYSSQLNVSDPGDEPETYISGSDYFKQMEARARYYGHLGGFTFGEPLKYQRKAIPVSDFDFLLKTDLKR